MNTHHQPKSHFLHEIIPLLHRGFDAEQEDICKDQITFQNNLYDENAYIMVFDKSPEHIKQ